MALLKVVGDIVASNTITGDNIAANTISAAKIRNDVNIGGPRITSIAYYDDNTAADTAGGETITITGSGFNAGATVLIESVAVSLTTVANSSTITFTAPAKSSGSYILYVVNTDGSTAILVPGIQYSGTPTWTTSAGTLGTFYETTSIANTVAATGDGTITYSLLSGALPTGATLNSNGTISGSAPLESGSSTYTFTLNAVDAQNQETSRQFSITVNTDPVTWSAPANNATITTYEYVAISNTFVATSATGKTISYSANVLPANVSISGATVSGTPTTVGNTTSLITATAETTGRTKTQTLNFVVAQDVVTWGSPANNTTYTLPLNAANTVSLSATSAAGFNVSYTANSLPTGLTVSGSSITGTPTVAGNSSSLITATAATTGRTAALTLNWVIQILGDSFWKNTSLLLSANTSAQTNSFVNDASLNNHQLTVFGDTRPSNFNPYQDGYYSNFFDGTGDSLYIPNNSGFAFGTGDFTIEYWMYANIVSGTTNGNIVGYGSSGGTGASHWNIMLYLGDLYYQTGQGTSNLFNVSIVPYANKWTHYAFVRSSGTTRLYINGVQQASGTDSTNYTATTTTPLSVGYNTELGYLRGYISNLRIVKGTAVYTSAFTPSTTPLTAVSGTSLLTCQSTRFIDNSVNNHTITRNGDTAVSSAYPFPTPTTSNTTVNVLGSAYFDGISNYLTMPDSTSLQLGSGNFTVEGWFSPLSTKAGSVVCFYTKGVNTTGGIIFGVSSDYVLCRHTGATDLTYYSGAGSNSGRWVHVAWVRSGNTLTIYRDGVSVASATVSFNQNDTGVVNIGSVSSVVDAGNRYGGYVSDFRIVKGTALYTANFLPPQAPLTPVANTQLLTLQYNGSHNNSTFKDNSSFNNLITRSGNPTQGTFSPYGDNWSNYFDGTGDYLQLPASVTTSLSETYTIEAWCYLNAAPTGTTWDTSRTLLAQNSGSSIYHIWALTTSGLLMVTRNGASYQTVTSNTSWPTNQWFHVAITNVGTTVKLYINGSLTGSLTQSAGTWNATAGYSAIGSAAVGTAGSSGEFNGYISNFRIVNGTEVYTTNFTPPTAPLTVTANTVLLTCADNRFIDESPNNFTITRNGDVSVQKFSPFSTVTVPKYYSAYFDGTGDYLTVPNNAALQMGSGDFTIEYWINYSSVAGYITPFTKGYTSAGDLLFQTGNGDGRINVYMSGSIVITESSAAVANRWYHYALVRNGTSLVLYRNGVSVGSATNSTNLTSTQQVGIGATGTAPGGGSVGQYGITGYISNLRIVKGTAVYTSAFTPSTTPLTAVSGTSLLTCQSDTIKDNSSNAFNINSFGDTKPLPVSPFTPTASSPTNYSANTFGGSIYFDGSGDSLTVANTDFFNVSATNYTIEYWIYFANHTFSGYQGHVTSYNSSSGGSFYVGTLNSVLRVNTGNDTSVASGSTTLTNGRWYHVAVVRDGTTSMKTFLNGVLEMSSTTYNWTGSTQPCYIGLYSGGNASLNAYIADVRITKGTALYTSNFFPPTAPLTPTTRVGANTVSSFLLINGSDGGVDDVTRTVDIETAGDARVTQFSPYNGSYYSNYFDGASTTSYFTIPNNAAFDFPGDFTIEWWSLKTSNGSNGYDCVVGTDTNGSGATWFVELSTSRGLALVAGSSVRASNSSITINDGTWHHYAVSRSSGLIYLFQDGVQLGTAASYNSTLSSGGVALQIGREGTYPYNGNISNLRIIKGTGLYTTSFTPSNTPLTAIANTVVLTCQSNAFVDNSTNAFTLTRNGTIAVRTQNPFQRNDGQSYYFDGTGDYISAVINSTGGPLNLGSGSFTMELWAYRTGAGTGDRFLLSKQNSSEFLFRWNSSNVLQFYINSTLILSYSYTFPTGSWIHLALVRNGSVFTLYLNGVSVATGTSSAAISGSATFPVLIGGYSGSDYFQGYLTDIRITQGTARYTTTFTPPTTPLEIK